MKRWKTGQLARGRLAFPGLLAALMVSPAFAQIGPITTQSLFFNQASNAHHGNYLEVDTGVIYTDNVLFEPGGPSDTLALLGLVGDLERVGSRFDYHIDSDISLVKYVPAEFQTQPFGYFLGSADFKIVPGFFSWLATESYNQAILTPYAPITPDNLEAINYASTGPRFTLRPTLRTTIILDGTYADVYSSSKSPLYVNIDNQRYGGDITVSRAFSSLLSAYVTGTAARVRFKDTIDNTDFTEYQGLAGLRFTDARTVIDVSGGYTLLHTTAVLDVQSIAGLRETQQDQAPSGVNWAADLSRLIRPTQRVSLHAQRLVTDASSLFLLNINQPVPTTTTANRIVNGQPFTYTSYGGTWRLEESRTSFQIDLLGTTQRYQATPTANADSKIASALIARQLSPVLNWDLGASYEHDDYAAGAVVNIVNAVTNLRWRLGERFGLRFIYAHSVLSPHGYHDNEVGILASYSLIPPGAAPQPGAAPALQPIAPASFMQSPFAQPPQ
jgi:hypothetical protein